MLHIGILTHNALDHTRRCLATLQANTSGAWRALVVDNASSDETPAWLSALGDPRIVVECRADNLGVSGGRNRILERLLPELADDDLLVFLDNDMELGPAWDRPFREAFAAQPQLGIAGKWAFSLLVHDSWRDVLAEEAAVDAPVDTVQGCCFVVRGATARAVGRFDASLGRFWHEDDDYCIRALHAGFEVRRVASSTMVHHEHGSGLALRPDRAAGSLRNQAYLARKWRSFAAIDADGVPIRPVADPTAPARRALAERLGRRQPVLRTELQNALVHVHRLLQREPTPDECAQRATPLVRVMLHETAAADPSPVQRERAAATLQRAAAVLAHRRAQAIVGPSPRPARAFNLVCDPAQWDDPRWGDTVRTLLRDGRGVDWYHRDETFWRDGQLAHALKATGALRRDVRALCLGASSERLIGVLSQHVGTLVVADREPLTVDDLQAASGLPLGNAALTIARWPLPAADTFDLIVCPAVTRFGPASALGAFLQSIAARLSAGGLLAVGTSVRVAGPADGRWCDADALFDAATLATVGLARVGAADTTVVDDVLFAAAAPECTTLRPQFARQVGPHLVSQATLLARPLLS